MPLGVNPNQNPLYIPDATQTQAGLMSIADKVKLDGIPAGGGGIAGLTATRIPVATAPTTVADSNFTAVANVLGLGAAGTLQLGNANADIQLGNSSAKNITFTGRVASNITFLKESPWAMLVAASTTAATAGGAFTITAGDGNGAAGGALTLDAGTGTAGGAVAIGTVNAGAVTISRAGITTTFGGSVALPPAATISNSSQGATNTTGLTIQPNVADGATSVGLDINTGTTLANATASFLRIRNNTTSLLNTRPFNTDGVKLVDGGGSSYLQLSTNAGSTLGYTGGASVFTGLVSVSMGDGTGILAMQGGNLTATVFDLSPEASNTRTFGAIQYWASARAGRLIAVGNTTGNALSVAGNASNVSAMATFADSNAKVRFGVDDVGLPSIGSNHYETEGFANLSTSYQTTGAIAICPKFAVAITGTALGVKHIPAVYDTTSVINEGAVLDAGATAGNAAWLYNDNIALLANNTSTVAVWEWSAMIPTDFTNLYAQMGVTASASVIHPNGFGILRRTGTDTNWQLFYDDGVTKTIVAPTIGVAPTASRWQRFKIAFYGSTSPLGAKTAKFFVDNTLIGTLTGTQVVTPAGGSVWIAGASAIASVGTQYLAIAEYAAWWSLVTTPLSP